MNQPIENGTNPSEPHYNVDSCDAILDTAKTVYAEEQARFIQYENKTNIGLAFGGVILVAYLTYLGSNKLLLHDTGYLIYSILLRLSVLILFTIGIIYFLRAIKSGDYKQVDLSNIVVLSFAQDPVETVKIELAATYKSAVDENKTILDKKTKFYDIGLTLVTRGFLIFVIYFVIEEVIKYVK
ncbi:hypothetical protein [Sutcliffiella halmapala]|uniref:hypothetical protein n=1 Tax=Sutcliffiella halmapala TaxID=79882 RepID=UPI000995CF91|nr:hypothetical protein [Sutcliffiella halmapala]